jgi:hypothetical protein
VHGPDRRHLDHPRVRGKRDLQRGVVQVGAGTALEQRAQLPRRHVRSTRLSARPRPAGANTGLV